VARDPGEPATVGVGGEEVARGAARREEPDDDQRDQEDHAGPSRADPEANLGADCDQGDDRERPGETQNPDVREQ
jgi:hypothetical protein